MPTFQVFTREIYNSVNNSRADGVVDEGNYAEIIQNTVPFAVGYYFNLVLSQRNLVAYFGFHKFTP